MLEAICARIIPTDANGPGASEARAAHYIDRALGGALSPPARPTRPGSRRSIATPVRHAGRRSPSCRRRDQDSVLIDVETGAATGFTGALGAVLRHGPHAHAAGHLRRPLLRRQRELRRLGSDRLSGRPDDRHRRRSAPRSEARSRITSRPTTTTCSPRPRRSLRQGCRRGPIRHGD